MASHIFHKTDNPQPDDRALCYFFKREQNQSLDEHVNVCQDCQVMAHSLLTSSVIKHLIKKPE